MHHFSYITHSYSLQNNLHKDVYNYLKTVNRKVIPAPELENFRKSILDNIAAIEEKHPRCKMLNVHWSEPHELDEGDYTLYFGSGTICHFQIYSSSE
jgi:hypothetical protein